MSWVAQVVGAHMKDAEPKKIVCMSKLRGSNIQVLANFKLSWGGATEGVHVLLARRRSEIHSNDVGSDM